MNITEELASLREPKKNEEREALVQRGLDVFDRWVKDNYPDLDAEHPILLFGRANISGGYDVERDVASSIGKVFDYMRDLKAEAVSIRANTSAALFYEGSSSAQYATEIFQKRIAFAEEARNEIFKDIAASLKAIARKLTEDK